MKVHYINILLFALPLNILVNSQKNSYITSHRLTKRQIKSHRSLCECDLYTSIYDEDPEMKNVMQDFDRQTSQRFKEYDERMQEKRQNCKEKCEKDIQTIILKDKIQKELTGNFSSLQTDISTDDVPTCVCEKSVADKVEKTCLKCGGVLGGSIPGLGLIGGTALYAINLWKDAELAAAIQFATKKGIKEGIKAGIQASIEGVKDTFGLENLCKPRWTSIFTANNYSNKDLLIFAIKEEYITFVDSGISEGYGVLSFYKSQFGEQSRIFYALSENAKTVALKAGKAAEQATKETTKALTLENTAEITTVSSTYYTAIIASIVAIVVIVLVMLIIYLILRYRRKKKIKKKLQYIKLLKE
ncbi:PIR protein, putative [Plasmodium sp. gorilla clade G1]|nr:PIR protein, putative [Plasmodium sp. gorilla clade G1]